VCVCVCARACARACVLTHTHTLMVFFYVWDISSVKLFRMIGIDENLSAVLPTASWNCVAKMAAYLTLSAVAHVITHRPLNCQGKDLHTGRKQRPKCRFDVLIEGLDAGNSLFPVWRPSGKARCNSEVFIGGPIRYLACFYVLLLFVCIAVRR